MIRNKTISDDEIMELMQATYGLEDPEYSIALLTIDAQIKALKEQRELKAKSCKHPTPHISVEHRCYRVGDGYGGDDWVDEGFFCHCNLCDASAISTFEPYPETGSEGYYHEPQGDPRHIVPFLELRARKKEEKEQRDREYFENKERVQLAKLKDKYE